MTFQYKTLASDSKGIYKEKGSKFEAYAYPVENKGQIEQLLTALRKTHHKAHHHCYAYQLGYQTHECRSYDGGEPRHSAGDPILGQIRSFQLTNVLIIVVRYFGGTKLGIGGLTNAYREAAKRSIEANKIVVQEPLQVWLVNFAYPDMNRIMQLVKELNLVIEEQKLEDQCQLRLQVPLSRSDQLQQRLGKMHQFKWEII